NTPRLAFLAIRHRAPLGDPLLEAADHEAALVSGGDKFFAQLAAAVARIAHHYERLAVGRDLRDAGPQIGLRNLERAGDLPHLDLFRVAHVDERVRGCPLYGTDDLRHLIRRERRRMNLLSAEGQALEAYVTDLLPLLGRGTNEI